MNVEDCAKCVLRQGCAMVVTGYGASPAKLMIVDYNPDGSADMLNYPYQSRPGRLMKNLLGEAGLNVDTDVYYTYLVKCRAAKIRKEHAVVCSDWLAHEAKNVQPGSIIVLGKPASKYLLGAGFELGKSIHVSWATAPVTSWLHPNWILQHGREADRQTVEFFRGVRKCLDGYAKSATGSTSVSSSLTSSN